MKKFAVSALLVLAVAGLAIGCGKGKKEAADAKPVVKPEVTIQMYVMSKCPFGVMAVDGAIPAIAKFGGQVELKLDYIGNKDASGKFTSMHGEEEVKGNVIQLCAKEIAADKHLAFLTCQNKEWRSIPAGWEKCADEAKIDKAAMTKCIDGEQGQKLWAASAEAAIAAGASGSPTIKVNGKDFTGGRDARAFETYICDNFKDKNLTYCKDIPPPPVVKLIAITDKRCGPKCDTQGVISSLKQLMPGLVAEVKDYSDAGVAELCDKSKVEKLPAILFDKSVESPDNAEAMKQLERFLLPAGDYKLLRIASNFDPKAEICTDKIDNTGDGKIDCDDDTCKGSMDCRPEVLKSLELFVMSQCPYGTMAINAMKEVLPAFGKDMKLTVHYIAEKNGDQITSMHGQGEVDEDIRQLCAAKLYGANNKYMDYVTCRFADFRNPAWETCATGAIKAAAIKKCFDTEGKALLEEDIKIAKSLEIGGSPTWVVNGKTIFNGIAADVVQKQFCDKNPGLKGCEVKFAAPAPPAGGGGAPPAGGSCGN